MVGLPYGVGHVQLEVNKEVVAAAVVAVEGWVGVPSCQNYVVVVSGRLGRLRIIVRIVSGSIATYPLIGWPS